METKLKRISDSLMDSVWDSVKYSIGDAIWDSVWVDMEYVEDLRQSMSVSVGDSVCWEINKETKKQIENK